MKITDKDIGQWLKAKRIEKKLSTRYVSSKLGYSVGMPTLWEQGKRGMTAQTFMDYCRLLEADPNDLITEMKKREETNGGIRRKELKPLGYRKRSI